MELKLFDKLPWICFQKRMVSTVFLDSVINCKKLVKQVKAKKVQKINFSVFYHLINFSRIYFWLLS